jgi:transcriptional regulator with XRE-family HTH domain
MSHWIKNIGTEIDIGVLEESALAMAQATIQNAINEAGISRAELARRMECPRSFVSRMLCGNHNLTIKSMSRALAACGFEVRFQYAPIVWSWGAQVPVQAEEPLPAHAGSAMLATDESAGIAVPVCVGQLEAE